MSHIIFVRMSSVLSQSFKAVNVFNIFTGEKPLRELIDVKNMKLFQQCMSISLFVRL